MRRVGMWMLLQVCYYKMCDVMDYDIYLFVSARSIKNNFMGLEDFQYPSNLI
ncbi:hypothetical protein BD769DRAFT_1495076 [Suillus cothurnatus]|nr:hypothetical protein BD769DRAFT_1495076 [Suillus cothurnatus]